MMQLFLTSASDYVINDIVKKLPKPPSDYNVAFINTASEVEEGDGTHLRKLRLDRELTQEELADKAGMHFTYIGQIERGVRNPSLINLEKIARALKIGAGELLPF